MRYCTTRRRSAQSVTSENGMTIVELLVVVAIVGLLAILALPNYLTYRGKAHQAEVKLNLAGIFTAQNTFYAEQRRFSDIAEINYVVVGQNRYFYRSQRTDGTGAAVGGPLVIAAASGADPGENPAPYQAQSSTTGFTASAAANLDSDPTIDRWFVNDVKQDGAVAVVNDVHL